MVNPKACHETELIYTPAEIIKKIAVVGGGPAGLACAHIAALRGHKVTLYEASDKLGGQFNLAKVVPGKEEYAETIRYFEQMLIKYKVRVKLNTKASVSDFMDNAYDEIIMANGIVPRNLEIIGSDHPKVVSYVDVLSRKIILGKTVAIIGAGGIGFDVASFLSHQPADVDEIETFLNEWGIDDEYRHSGALKSPEITPSPRDIFLLKRSSGKHGVTLGKTTGWIHKANLNQKKVKMLSDVNYIKVDDQGLHIEIKGESSVLNVDHIVVCAGQLPGRYLYDELKENGLQPHLIGGADEAAELDAKRAIYQACHLGAKI